MTDDADRSGTTAGEARSAEPDREGADDASPDDAAAAGHAVADAGLLDRVPAWVVPLGAGSLATATLITFGAAAFAGYSVATGQYYGYAPYQLALATGQFALVTVFQAAGVYLALQRTRWLLVMLAALAGTLTFIPIPFTVVALLCLGLGRRHFAAHTPHEQLRPDAGSGETESTANDGDESTDDPSG